MTDTSVKKTVHLLPFRDIVGIPLTVAVVTYDVNPGKCVNASESEDEPLAAAAAAAAATAAAASARCFHRICI